VDGLPLDKVVHVQQVLYHWRSHNLSTARRPLAKGGLWLRRRVLATRWCGGLTGRASVTTNIETPQESSSCRISLRAETSPLVSIVIPTKNNLLVLRKSVESLLNRTTYSRYELIIVDNGSTEPDLIDYLSFLKSAGLAQVITMPIPFNFSKLVNVGVANSSGEMICLLNDDTEVSSGEWLDEMVGWANLDGVGAVGARLWYPDGRLQHGGVILGVGGVTKVAGHAHKYLERQNPGYMSRAVSSQLFSAVTGACLVVARDKWDQAKGFDEELQVAFNDVDFCLRIQKLGYVNVWTPNADLIHHESVSRGLDKTPEQIRRAALEVELLIDRWGDELRQDLSYSAYLSSSHENFSFATDVDDLREGVISPFRLRTSAKVIAEGMQGRS